MSKEWSADITIRFTQFGFEAETRDDFIDKLKHSFAEEHNINLSDDEITNVVVLDSLSDVAIARKKAREQNEEEE